MEDANGRLSVSENLYLPLSGKTKKLTAMKDVEWEILDRKALGTVWLCLAASVAFNISKERQQRVLLRHW